MHSGGDLRPSQRHEDDPCFADPRVIQDVTLRRRRSGACNEARSRGLGRLVRAGSVLHSASQVHFGANPRGSTMIRKVRADQPRKRRRTTAIRPESQRRWSKRVTEMSNALDLEEGAFRSANPRRIALSLKRSAERSHRRKATPFQSAMSMLTFFINRAGGNLSPDRVRVLNRAKEELRAVFHQARKHRRKK
jgi:uncharacterized protein DUF3175